MKAGIVGAGIAGRLLAFLLVKNGWNVSLFDKDELNGDACCSMAAAGLLTPIAELEKCDPIIYELGKEALLYHWPEIINTLKTSVFYQKKGSLIVAHPQDETELDRFIRVINMKLKHSFVVSSRAEMMELEPEITKFEKGYHFVDEGHLDNQTLLNNLKDQSIQWYANTRVDHIEPGKITWNNTTETFDCVFDCRGLGAKSFFKNLRGIRGELIWLQAPEVNIQRPVRLLHPRYSLYIVPRPNQIYILGASEIESENAGPISVRTTLELLSAAYYVHAGFAEARILKTAVNCRPTLDHHLPEIKYTNGLIAINGLYRHGFLIAPTLVKDVVAYLQQGMSRVKYQQLWVSFQPAPK